MINKDFFRNHLYPLVAIKRILQVKLQKLSFRNKSNAEIFKTVYKKKYWGGKGHKFYSGRGSYDSHIIDKYIASLRLFLKCESFVVVDAGCGDMHVGSQLMEYCKAYIGVDVVQELIDYHKAHFAAIPNVDFLCLDLANDILPQGDVIIFRQVLQHLSNNEILKIIRKLDSYKYIIITEPLPFGDFTPNKDNFTGPDIRLSRNSGVSLHDEPFNLRYKNIEVLCEVQDINDKAIIRTIKYTL